MFPDLLPVRIALRTVFFCLSSIAPVAILYSLATLYASPSSPATLLPFAPQPFARQIESGGGFWRYYLHVEAVWWIIHTAGIVAINRGWLDYRGGKSVLNEEDRWRILRRMLEGDGSNPWSWMGGWFSLAGKASHAPGGAEDPLIRKVKMEEVGSTNIKDFLAETFFSKPLDKIPTTSPAHEELNRMLKFVEAAITHSRTSKLSESMRNETIPFSFPPGRSIHRLLSIRTQPITAIHHPLVFYAFIKAFSETANAVLALCGFRWYGPRRSYWTIHLFQNASRSALDKALGHDIPSSHLDNSVGYWYHPGRPSTPKRTPLIFMHGISGSYGPTPFILMLSYFTGRAMFVQVQPYITMQLSLPSAILQRRHVVAGARRMLIRHGFGGVKVENGNGDLGLDGAEGVSEKVVVVCHSMGAGPTAWLLRDAPDIVAGTVLIDPMSVLLYCADAPRNFLRTKLRTAGEIFFAYFAAERGISHFLCRHLEGTDAVIFAPSPSSASLPPTILANLVPASSLTPLPLDSVSNYAPTVNPSPHGPIPTIFFYSELDCILPVAKTVDYLKAGGFGGENLVVMEGLDHAAVLISPRWTREVIKAIERVAKASEELEWVKKSKKGL